MKQVIDVAIRFRQELEKMKLVELYYLLGIFSFSDDVYMLKMEKMIIERIDELKKHAYVYNF